MGPTDDETRRLNLQYDELARQQRFAEALPVLQRLAALNPDNPVALRRLALLHRRLGSPSKAVECFRAAAQLYAAKGELRRSVEPLEQALEVEPANPSLQRELAQAKERAAQPSAGGGARPPATAGAPKPAPGGTPRAPAPGHPGRFVYDERTSRLFAPDGTFLKHLFCPLAVRWNQLLSTDPEDRSRGCPACAGTVLNLDKVPVAEAVATLSARGSKACVYVRSDSSSVVFLRDPQSPLPTDRSSRPADAAGTPLVQSVWGEDDINRAAGMGYWPDVRLMASVTGPLESVLFVEQHQESGRIAVQSPTGNRPGVRPSGGAWKVVLPASRFSPHPRAPPLAAYLIPRALPDGARVTVEEPLEDVVGSTSPNGSTLRARNLGGRLVDRTVVLELDAFQPRHLIG
jgi:hypothetical protein